MCANMFHNIKYMQCRYGKEQMDVCANHCPKIILGEIPKSIINSII
jgi:hypothetical protein